MNEALSCRRYALQTDTRKTMSEVSPISFQQMTNCRSFGAPNCESRSLREIISRPYSLSRQCG
jgi:hypothetical protein